MRFNRGGKFIFKQAYLNCDIGDEIELIGAISGMWWEAWKKRGAATWRVDISKEIISKYCIEKPTKENKMDKVADKFYMVVADPNKSNLTTDGHANIKLANSEAGPKCFYNTRSKAEDVAEHMAKQYNKKFFVVEAVCSFEVEQPVVKKNL